MQACIFQAAEGLQGLLIALPSADGPSAVQSLTKKPVKGMLTGPVTILNWSFPRKDISRRAQAVQLGLALREEVAELEKAGCRVIQVLLASSLFELCSSRPCCCWQCHVA